VAERSAAREERLVESADSLGDDAVEPPHLHDLFVRDSLTLVRESPYEQAPLEHGAACTCDP
jgi:hypothetical protein